MSRPTIPNSRHIKNSINNLAPFLVVFLALALFPVAPSWAQTKTLTIIPPSYGMVGSLPSGINCNSGGPSCMAGYEQGTIVTLKAIPVAGSYFSIWSGDACNGNVSLTCLVTMDADKTITASFTQIVPVMQTWLKTYGGEYSDYGYAIRQTSDGGYIVAGSTEPSDEGYSNAWVTKLDQAGNVLWQKTYGASSSDSVNSIQQTSDGGYIVAGSTESFGEGYIDVWVLKLDSNGEVLWLKTYGAVGDDYANSVQQTSDGGYIIVGYTSSFGVGDLDVWVLKLRSDGSVDWQKRYDGSGGDDYANSVQQTSDGGYIIAGYTSPLGNSRGGDAWVLKLQSNGDVLWQKTYGNEREDTALAIQQTVDGGYIVAGYTHPSPSDPRLYYRYIAWVIKLGQQGDVLWQNNYEVDFDTFANSIQQTPDGGFIVAGKTGGAEGSFFKALVIKLNPDGDVDWGKTYTNDRNDGWNDANTIQQTSDGGYVLVGSTNSFGAGEYYDYYDAWVLKLDSTGNISGELPVNFIAAEKCDSQLHRC